MTKFYTSAILAAMTIFGASAQNAIGYTVTPNPAVGHNSISEVNVKFDTDHEILIMGYDIVLVVNDPAGFESEVTGDWVDYDIDPTVLGFTFDEPLTTPGVYHFLIPKNSLFDYETEEYLPEIQFDITVNKPYSDYADVTPLPGAYEKLPSNTVEMVFKDVTDVKIAEGAKAEIIVPNGDKALYDIAAGENPFTAKFSLGSEFETGTYYVEIPKNTFTITYTNGDTEELPNMSFSYNIVNPAYVVAPPAGDVWQLWTVIVNFNKATNVKVATNTDDITITGPDGNLLELIVSATFNAIDITIQDNYLPAGEYTLVIKPGTLSVDGMIIDEEIKVVYNMKSNSSVESIEFEGKAADIFGIDGTVKARKAESTEGLEKGIYIVNGKKVIVK